MRSSKDKVIARIYQYGFLLFPIVGVTVKDAGSAIFTLFALIGLVYGWKGWVNLDSQEKTVLIGFVVFVATAALSLVATDDWHTAAHRIDRLLRFLLVIPVYLVIRRFDIRILRYYVAGVVVSGVVLGLVVIYKIFVLKTGSTEGPYNSAFIGNYAVIVSAFIVVLFLSGKPGSRTGILLSVSLIASIVTMVLSGSRTSWIAFVAIVVVALLFELRRKRALVMTSFVILLAATVSLYHYPVVHQKIGVAMSDFETYKKDPGKSSSVNDRLSIWRNMITLFRSSPLVGAGLGDYAFESNKLIREGKSLTTHIHNSAHSIYFESLGMSGIIGFVGMLLGLFIMPFRSFYQIKVQSTSVTPRIFSQFGILTVFSFAIFGLSGTWYAFNAIVNLYIVSMLACLACCRGTGENLDDVFKFEKSRAQHP